MRKRLSIMLLLCGPLLLSTGCRKAEVVRGPTHVVAEEPEPHLVVRAAAGSEEQDASAHPKETLADPVAFHFPADQTGELLSKQLSPSHALPEPPAQPHRTKIVSALESPELPLPQGFVEFTSTPTRRASRLLLPRLVTPESMNELALEVRLPEAQPMPVGERTKQAGPNVNKPAPLPILGQQVPDRASLGDATAEASGAAVVSGAMPVRQAPVPFLRLSIPDPFENYRPLRLPLPAEAIDPVTASPRTP